MTIIHANDPTTKVLSLLYDTKDMLARNVNRESPISSTLLLWHALLPNDRYLLENETFRLYYTSASTEAHKFSRADCCAR